MAVHDMAFTYLQILDDTPGLSSMAWLIWLHWKPASFLWWTLMEVHAFALDVCL